MGVIRGRQHVLVQHQVAVESVWEQAHVSTVRVGWVNGAMGEHQRSKLGRWSEQVEGPDALCQPTTPVPNSGLKLANCDCIGETCIGHTVSLASCRPTGPWTTDTNCLSTTLVAQPVHVSHSWPQRTPCNEETHSRNSLGLTHLS